MALKKIVSSQMPYKVQGVPGQSVGAGGEPSYAVGNLGISPNMGGYSQVSSAPRATTSAGGPEASDRQPWPDFVQANTDKTGPVQAEVNANAVDGGMRRPTGDTPGGMP